MKSKTTKYSESGLK